METGLTYRKLIQEELAKRTDRNPQYSLRSFARALGLDAAALSRILADKKVPSKKMAEKIVHALALSPEQEQAFTSSLLERHRTRKLERANGFLKSAAAAQAQAGKPQIAGLPEQHAPLRELSVDLFRVIADWYHFAVLEITFTKGFRDDPKWIARELGISPTEAKLALDRLQELGLLKRDEQGKLVKTDALVTFADKQRASAANRRRHRQILEKAVDSLENDPPETRGMTSMTMAVDPARIPQAVEMIKEFNRKLCAFLEGGERKQVYELGVALYPLQKPRSETQE